MKRFSGRDSSLLRMTSNHGFGDDDGDEEKLYERQALIDDDELCGDDENHETNPVSDNVQFGIRQRQSPSKSKSISNIITNNNGSNNIRPDEAHELKNINNNNNSRTINDQANEYTIYDIQPGDSLQRICFRYACSYDQVKRINGIMNDQELYARRKIKLPLGKLGILNDLLKQTNSSNDNRDLLLSENQHIQIDSIECAGVSNPSTRPRLVNSPGSALSVSTRRSPQFKPLLSPGFSSDRINELNRISSHANQNNDDPNSLNSRLQHNHSNSFSSLRDFTGNDVEIDISPYDYQPKRFNMDTARQETFIKSNRDQHEDNVDVDDILMMEGNDNVEKVFEDLDYHVERAKAVAGTYDQRAAELVDSIQINGSSSTNDDILFTSQRTRVSKIPELFFCNENFGLSFKKLLLLIFVVCLVFPLVYIKSLNVNITKQH